MVQFSCDNVCVIGNRTPIREAICSKAEDEALMRQGQWRDRGWPETSPYYIVNLMNLFISTGNTRGCSCSRGEENIGIKTEKERELKRDITEKTFPGH